MGYSKNIYMTAQNKLDSRRKTAVEQLEIRFAFEEERTKQGLSITNRDFHRELKERLKKDVN